MEGSCIVFSVAMLILGVFVGGVVCTASSIVEAVSSAEAFTCS